MRSIEGRTVECSPLISHYLMQVRKSTPNPRNTIFNR